MDEVLLIASARDPVVADYAAYASRIGGRRVSVISTSDVSGRIKERVELHTAEDFSQSLYLDAHSHDCLAGVVVFLSRQMTERDRGLVKAVAKIAIEKSAGCVCLASSFRVHFGDRRAARTEEWAINQLRGFQGRVIVFRPGPINSSCSRLSACLWKLRFLASVVPGRFRSCCVEGEELFAAIEQELKLSDSRKRRTFTLLGPNQPWKDLLARKSTEHPLPAFVRLAALLLRLMLLGQFAGLLFDFAQWFPGLWAWNFDTLSPNSVRELLALYNKYNYRYVKIVGYNNGVIHFGQSYPGKTVLSTVGCNRVARLRGDLALFDGGVTIRQAMEMLQAQGKELHVVPNYSYVSLGTSYFIPIHGSASKYCTVAETIENVFLYDPVEDRFIPASRQDAAFGHYIYNLSDDVLLLQLTLKVKEKTRYYMKMQKRANLSSRQVWDFFQDATASNVEIRKAGAASPEVKVCQYYTSPPDGDADALELPRDTLGSLWDRLESNPITSALMHGLARRLAHHVELFLPEDDFAAFWETHSALPLSKIQLRYIRRDGFPNSPFRE
ncbi:MAG TPA: hypothetical protein VH592_19495, partial [Gemmataceae bacterium]